MAKEKIRKSKKEFLKRLLDNFERTRELEEIKIKRKPGFKKDLDELENQFQDLMKGRKILKHTTLYR